MDFDPTVIELRASSWIWRSTSHNPDARGAQGAVRIARARARRRRSLRSRASAAARVCGERSAAPLATRIEPLKRFWPAEDYHQKYYLRNDRLLTADFRAMFGGDETALRESTAAARVNGYIAGDGTRAQLGREIDFLGLSERARTHLVSRVGHGASTGGCGIGVRRPLIEVRVRAVGIRAHPGDTGCEGGLMGGSRKNRRAHSLAQPRTFFAALAVIWRSLRSPAWRAVRRDRPRLRWRPARRPPSTAPSPNGSRPRPSPLVDSGAQMPSSGLSKACGARGSAMRAARRTRPRIKRSATRSSASKSSSIPRSSPTTSCSPCSGSPTIRRVGRTRVRTRR